jgi:hypothetical protein
MILYALVVSVCLSNGECYDLSPELYEDMTTCVMESSYQRKQGIHSYCEEMKEESLEEAITRQ